MIGNPSFKTHLITIAHPVTLLSLEVVHMQDNFARITLLVQLTKYRTLLKLSPAHNFDFLFPNGRFIDQAKTKATINSSSVLENEQAWKHG